MKKISVIFLSIIFFFACVYADEAQVKVQEVEKQVLIKDIYLKSCSSLDDRLLEFCQCSYQKLVEKMSEEELLKMVLELSGQPTQKHIEIVRQASLQCEDKMPLNMYIQRK